jgi:hypothetical protein
MPKIARPTKPLADVNLLPQKDGSIEVVACIMPDPDKIVGEGQSRAVIAMDGSKSIKDMFGFAGPFGGDPNYAELVSRKLGAILCDVTKDGKTSLLYWATGPKGAEIQEVGNFDATGWAKTDISGPAKWGTGTQLLPPLRHIVETIGNNSNWTMGVIITDGIIEDEEDCMKYCMKIGREIASDKRKGSIKLVLIGVGKEVDEEQLERFDDMFEGTDLEEKVDLWSHGMVKHMRDESDIIAVLFGELMTEELIVASSGSVLDDKDNEVISFPDGMPGKFRFILSKGCKSFTVHTPKGDITQDISSFVGTV